MGNYSLGNSSTKLVGIFTPSEQFTVQFTVITHGDSQAPKSTHSDTSFKEFRELCLGYILEYKVMLLMPVGNLKWTTTMLELIDVVGHL